MKSTTDCSRLTGSLFLFLLLMASGCTSYRNEKPTIPEPYEQLPDQCRILVAEPSHDPEEGYTFEEAVEAIGTGSSDPIIRRAPEGGRAFQDAIIRILRHREMSPLSGEEAVYIPHRHASSVQDKSITTLPTDQFFSPDTPVAEINNQFDDDVADLFITGRIIELYAAPSAAAEQVTNRILPDDTGVVFTETKWIVYNLNRGNVLLKKTITDESLVDLDGTTDTIHELRAVSRALNRLWTRISWILVAEFLPHRTVPRSTYRVNQPETIEPEVR